MDPYIPPPGNQANFSFQNVSYVPPPGDQADFVFGRTSNEVLPPDVQQMNFTIFLNM